MRRPSKLHTAPPSRSRLLGRLLLLAAVLVAVAPLLRGFQAETSLRYRLGEQHARYDELELRYFDEEEEVAGARFGFPRGAPATFDHTVTLPRGAMRVELTLRGDGTSLRRSHRFETPVEGTLVLGP